MKTSPANIRELLGRAETKLVESGVPNARRNAEWMLCHTLGWSVLDLYMHATDAIDATHIETYWECVERRASREPLQYILGNTEFMSFPFEVQPGVFVPRPETEVLVEHAEARLRGIPLHRELSVLDLCCGSGIIGVSLARRVPNLRVTSVDISRDAVMLTRHNANINGVSTRVRVAKCDALTFMTPRAPCYTAILCNPPYIATGELAALPREVREHEPVAALDGGADGLDFYRRLIPTLAAKLQQGGFVMFEIGDTQGPAVGELLRSAGFGGVEVIQDLSGRDRVVTAREVPLNG
ncbi:MAG TPA: peptide chain release factor N(5)-glutamine methyltransferase [Candidatus Krumholzibacteria bacterium]